MTQRSEAKTWLASRNLENKSQTAFSAQAYKITICFHLSSITISTYSSHQIHSINRLQLLVLFSALWIAFFSQTLHSSVRHQAALQSNTKVITVTPESWLSPEGSYSKWRRIYIIPLINICTPLLCKAFRQAEEAAELTSSDWLEPWTANYNLSTFWATSKHFYWRIKCLNIGSELCTQKQLTTLLL